MKIVITESASDDIAEAYLFYEEQYTGLGDYFETSLLVDIRSLAIYAGIHEIHFGIYFRKIASKFPHAIYYTLESDIICIYAVADTRRDPIWLKSRISPG